MNLIAKKIEITGLVQGVGFRPFIYRLATHYKLFGTVENNNKGVLIIIEGLPKNIRTFENELPNSLPEAANISFLKSSIIEPNHFVDFQIIKSSSLSDEITEVSPDIAVCQDCMDDMKKQPQRIDYPFINCTNCGPRFTIIRDLPYDRDKTTMNIFEMCESCKKEYTHIFDRRFHAQPIACNQCGPKYSLLFGTEKFTKIHQVIDKSSELLEIGKIMAIKGLGGYHMACNPFLEKTVQELRSRKSREGKPLALMFKDLRSIKQFLLVNPTEEKILQNWRRPVVLLKMKENANIAKSVSIGLNTIGAMLPYLPFHHMLFEKISIPAIVLTSGNVSEEPILIDDEQAMIKLGKISDAVVFNNRPIYNRADDSVVFIANSKERIIRRSRGFVPSPIILNLDTEGIFSGGAELVNCFCIGKMNQAILSQHIGDLKNLETYEFYTESVNRFKRLFRFEPTLAVMDMHPDYLSSQFVREMNLPVLKIQHHHAHIAACMAENGLDEELIGVSFDGTGYGDDGNIWGGEFLICDLEKYTRFSHFEYIQQPGGDAANKHPWRIMLSYLYHYFGEKCVNQFPFLFEKIEKEQIELIFFMLKNNINSPLTSSAGRLFDAVSALLNIVRHSSYHAEAPMRLEAIADENVNEFYSFDIKGIISFKKTFEEIISDLQSNIPISVISGKFHQTIVEVIFQTAKKIKTDLKINKVVLSGGTFQNRILLEKTENLLAKNGFEVFSHSRVPSNDGGIALGQLVIAAKKRQSGNLKPM